MCLKKKMKNVAAGCILTCSIGLTGSISAAASEDLPFDGF